jgi:RNA polymerase sigma factor (sigma-70 family)
LTDNLDDIVKGCIAEKIRSQDELYRILAPKMYAVCLRYASDPDEAKDYLQEGFIRVFTKINSYRREGSFEGWVRKIMVNTALQFLRKKRMFLIDEEIMIGEADYYVTDIQNDLAEKDLLSMIRQLPDSQRMVFNLFVIEGYNHSEIAKMTGIPENTSKSHLHRARLALKDMVVKSTADSHKLKKNV